MFYTRYKYYNLQEISRKCIVTIEYIVTYIPSYWYNYSYVMFAEQSTSSLSLKGMHTFKFCFVYVYNITACDRLAKNNLQSGSHTLTLSGFDPSGLVMAN